MRFSYAMVSVVTPASSRDLTTLSWVKTVLNIQGGAEDDFLKKTITQASAAAENYCNRVFASETVQAIFRPQRGYAGSGLSGGFDPLQLPRWPISSVSSVVTLRTLTDDPETLVLDTDYEINAASGQLGRLNSDGNPRNWEAIKTTVVFAAGYTLPGQAVASGIDALPADIEAGVLEIIKGTWFSRERDPAVRSENIPEIMATSYQIAMPTGSGLPAAAEALLDNYRVPVVA